MTLTSPLEPAASPTVADPGLVIRHRSRDSGPSIVWTPSERTWSVAVTVLSMLACLALAAPRLSRQSFWTDEARNLAMATDSRPGGLERIWHQQPTVALYRTLLGPWTGQFSSSEAGARSLSLLCTLLTVVVLAAICWQLGARSVLPAAVLLLGTNASVVAYATEAGPFALAMMLTSVAVLALVCASAPGAGRPRWLALGFVVAAALAVYAHPICLPMLLASSTAVAWCRPASRRLMLLAAVSVLLACLPLAALQWTAGIPDLGWIARQPSAATSTLTFWTGEQPRWAAGLLLIIASLAALAWLRSGVLESFRDVGPLTPLVLAWLWLPLGMLLLLAAPFTPLLVPRALTPALPAVALTLALGVRLVRPLALAVLATAGLLAIQGAGLAAPRTDHGSQEWRPVAAIINRAAAAGATGSAEAVVVMDQDDVLPLTYYLRGTAALEGDLPDRATGTPSDWFVVPRTGRAQYRAAGQLRGPRVWLVRSARASSAVPGDLAAGLRRYRVTGMRRVGEVELVRYQRLLPMVSGRPGEPIVVPRRYRAEGDGHLYGNRCSTCPGWRQQ